MPLSPKCRRDDGEPASPLTPYLDLKQAVLGRATGEDEENLIAGATEEHATSRPTCSQTSFMASGTEDRVTSMPTCSELPAHTRSVLFKDMKSKMRNIETSEHHDHSGHHSKPPSIITASISGVINFLLMFGLCCAYGMIMFGDTWNATHQGLGVKMNLSTAMVMGIGLALFSKVPVAIGGPDLNPVVFLGMFVDEISAEIAKQHGLVYPNRRLEDLCGGSGERLDERALLSSRWVDYDEASPRRLGGSCKKKGTKKKGFWDAFCTGEHLMVYTQECATYHNELRATSIFAVAVSSGLLMVCFTLVGRLRLTRFVSYMPQNIMEAFLSCVGYKVFKYALKFCLDDPKQFLPAAFIGVPLYFFKFLHIGNPAVVIPSFLFIPLGFFYLFIYIGYGNDSSFIDQARNDCLFFPIMEDVPFWKIWEDSIGSYSHINFKAWAKSIPDLVIMLIVCMLDCLLKLSSTESKLPVKADKDYEISLYGLCNFVVAACGSSVGYMQLKFNVINFGIINNVIDRRAGLIYATLCGVCFFWSIELINYLPRFFLGVLLFFAGAGFVAENLWGSRKHLGVAEWFQVLLIILVFIIFGSLLYAVIVGGLITGVAFIIKYASVPCIVGRPMYGGEIVTYQKYDPFLHSGVSHIANSWMLVLRLKGFLFFATAQKTTEYVTRMIEKQAEQHVPGYRRIKYIIFDCAFLDGMDASAAKAIQKCVMGASNHNVRILWSSIGPLLGDFLARGTLKNEADSFDDLQSAVLAVHEIILCKLQSLQDRWCLLHPHFKMYHELTRNRIQFDPLAQTLTSDVCRFGCPWGYCGRLKLRRYKTVLWSQHDLGMPLYLVHSGAVGIFKNLPGPDNPSATPFAYHRRGAWLNSQSLMKEHSRDYAVALQDGEVLFWDEHQWCRMARERPEMASAIMRIAMSQGSFEEAALEKLVLDHMHGQEEATEAKDVVTDNIMPESVRVNFRSMFAAHVLGELGFYTALGVGEDGVLPLLPDCVRAEFEVAFHTFCEKRGANGQDVLRWKNLQSALMYGGVYGTLLIKKGHALTKVEFLALAHEAFYVRLSTAMCDKLNSLFHEFDADRSGVLDVDELSELVKTLLHPIMVEAVPGIAMLWIKQSADAALNADQFCAFVSRLIRKHSESYLVLQAVEQIVGHPVMHDLQSKPHDALDSAVGAKLTESGPLHTGNEHSDSFTVDKATAALQKKDPSLTAMDVEEMFWAASSYGGSELNMKKLDFQLIFPVLLTVFESGGALPPEPKMTLDSSGVSDLDVTAEMMQEASCQMRLMIKDMRCHNGWKEGNMAVNNESLDDMPIAVEGNAKIPLVDNEFQSFHKIDVVIPSPEDLVIDEDGVKPNRRGEEVHLQPQASMDSTASADSDSNNSEDPCCGRISEKTNMTAQSIQDYLKWVDGQEKLRVKSIPNTWQASLHMMVDPHAPVEDKTKKQARASFVVNTIVACAIVISVLLLILAPLISPKDGSDGAKSNAQENILLVFEISIAAILTLELIIRWMVCDALRQAGSKTYVGFIKKPKNVLDMLVVMSFYIQLIDEGAGRMLRSVQILRAIRILDKMGTSKMLHEVAAPLGMVLTLIWGIYLKTHV